MNKKTFYMVILLLVIIFSSKVYGAPAMEAEADFAYVEGNEWILLELQSEGKIVPIDRQKLAAMNMPDVFTIRFQDGLLGGMGAPNRYTAPYSTGKNRTINIGLIASTMMFSFIEPDGLNE
ncbi:MAG: META domain-containing protein, partial [Treponema sp.]|nr:META domain-containing protein [Treponema sp.]